MSKKSDQQYCDDCGDPLTIHIVVYVSLPFDISSANKGESGCICGDCYNKHLATKYWETNDTK
jgi:hypothetical protein